MLSIIFGTPREEAATGVWTTFLYKEIHTIFTLRTNQYRII